MMEVMAVDRLVFAGLKTDATLLTRFGGTARVHADIVSDSEPRPYIIVMVPSAIDIRGNEDATVAIDEERLIKAVGSNGYGQLDLYLTDVNRIMRALGGVTSDNHYVGRFRRQRMVRYTETYADQKFWHWGYVWRTVAYGI